MRILMILVSEKRAEMPAMVRVDRFAAAYYPFKDAGLDVVLASPDGGDVPWLRIDDREQQEPLVRRLHGDAGLRDALADTIATAQVVSADFDGVFCLGVSGRPWEPELNDGATALIGRFLQDGKAVGVVPLLLDLAPVGVGRGVLIAGDTTAAALPVARALIAALLERPGPPAADDVELWEDGNDVL